MATVFSHAVAGIAISTLVEARGVRTRLAVATALCAAAPDLDVVTFWLGVPWGHMFSHRGITHSLAFAAVLAAVVTLAAFRGRGRVGIWLALFVATASHGVLDAMTSGGSGVAFFAPFDDTRYFLPWRPIPVSPIGVSRFLTQRGLDILKAELWQIWLPAGLVALVGLWRRGGR
ncbi:MAG TPA: metal-dependent hydrolase [Methylomirabilota bacterium]|jgi:inner membrane protein|nr:metal-dependent hydrolase [Methylomirabilota bacterium]